MPLVQKKDSASETLKNHQPMTDRELFESSWSVAASKKAAGTFQGKRVKLQQMCATSVERNRQK
jgi:hypothetical protein